jgi:outer membrane lipoprotein-sorting protein
MKTMKNWILAVIAVLLVPSAFAQTIDEVISKHIEAIGGKERLLALKSEKRVGNLNVQGFDIQLTISVVHSVGARTDIAVPGMGEGYQIVNTTKGWNYMPFQGQTSPEEVSEDKVKSGQNQLDLQGSLFNYKDKGHQVELLGKEKVDGVECYKIKLITKGENESTIFLDATTYLRTKVVAKVKTEEGDSELTTTYSNYKAIPEGYVYAHTQSNERGTIEFSTFEINKNIDESIFTIK